MKIILPSLLLFLTSCAMSSIQKNVNPAEGEAIPFDFAEEHFLSLPVIINNSKTKRFVFDTGIGINLISNKLCKEMGCKPVGQFTGKRMSGQEVRVDLVEIKSLSLGNLEVKNVVAGIFDMEKLMPGANIGGFLSVGFFSKQPITVDYSRKIFVLENKDSIKKIRSLGYSTPVTIHEDGYSTGIAMKIALPSSEIIKVELDTGSQGLILHEKYMQKLGFSQNSPTVMVRKGQDETGHNYVRYHSKIDGSLHIPESQKIGVKNMNVLFQKIIYEGLLGQFFLKPFVVTYDFEKSQIIFRENNDS